MIGSPTLPSPATPPSPATWLLTGPNHGTCFYLTADAPPTLVRVNHRRLVPAAAKRSADGASLGRTRPTPSGGRTWLPI
ncbi:MAG: hypothetical protein ACLUNZ_05160 [Evtepia sp.]